MTASFQPSFNTSSPTALARATAMRAKVESLRALEARATYESSKSRATFDKRGQLLPRDRVALLIDPHTPWLPLMSLVGYGLDVETSNDPVAQAKALSQSIPGGGMVAGIGFISGVRCMVSASDSGIEAGAIQAGGLQKILRVQEIALQNKLPFIHLVESAGANLLRYRVDGFVQGGALFRNLARLSAAGIPVLTIQHGSGTAGGAYMPGLSDAVIMVEGRSRAFLAGPPLLKAATGEIAGEEELGGAFMHASVSGLGEALVADDREAIGLARAWVAQWEHFKPNLMPNMALVTESIEFTATNSIASDDMLALMPSHYAEPVDMREVMHRLVDLQLFEFKALYGAATICAQGQIGGHSVGFISNNGPIDVAGANKATHFIQHMCQLGHPIIYLQNTTGYMVGVASEQAGMIKHGSKMIQAVTNASVPQITIQCGASFGAGNYGMCGRAFEPRFLFSWPGAQTAVMGGEQAAGTMREVVMGAFAKRGLTPSPEQSAKFEAQERAIVALFAAQQDGFITSGMGLDDGVIDPRDTRATLIECLDMCAQAATRQLRPTSFGVARM